MKKNIKKINKSRVCLTLNKDNLIYNIKNIKKKTKNLLVCAVIKDNAYNHGEVDTLHAVGKYVDFFAASTLQEALNIRKADKKKKILILGHIDKTGYEDAIKNNISLACSCYEQLVDIDKKAALLHKKATVHIALNTGMNRIGFPMSEKTIHELKIAQNLKNIIFEGIFSHFACCDTYTVDKFSKSFTDLQKDRFDAFVDALETEGITFIIRHIANSAGIIYNKFDNTDMVRPGIILYGVSPDESCKNKIKLKQALSLYTKVSFVKTINKDEYISYGATYRTKKPTKIATIQVGYGDGYPRILSNIQDVYINKKRCKIVGRITMDQTMIDVTNVKCNVGDTVELFGPHISIYEIAKNAKTIPYEIFCGLNKRIERELI